MAKKHEDDDRPTFHASTYDIKKLQQQIDVLTKRIDRLVSNNNLCEE